ncbi:hypothetical protein [Microbacterium sp.]|uniref:hypothetical protein n=1 Tax=Microbacterium sp. TaxID=51671 RepID=UPI0039E422D0
MTLAPTGGGDIVEQLNTAASRFRWAWTIAIVAAVLGMAMLPYGTVLWAVAIPLCWWLFLRDAARGKVVLLYDVKDATADWFDTLVTNWEWMTRSEKLWRTVQSGRVQTVYQHKTNAGAGKLVERIPLTARLTGPKHISTNVAVPTLEAGKAGLYFLPDRLLVREGKHYTDVAYARLRAQGNGQRFIESPGGLPRDAHQIDHTWQYVNVKGGPDRRFKNNPMLPIMLYGALDLTTIDGLNWQVQTSRHEAAPSIAQTLSATPRVDIVP